MVFCQGNNNHINPLDVLADLVTAKIAKKCCDDKCTCSDCKKLLRSSVKNDLIEEILNISTGGPCRFGNL